MSGRHTIVFQEALEMVESLPEYQQENLIDIVQHRLIENRRNEIARNITKAKKEYTKDDVHRGKIEDLMKEIP